MAYHHGNLHSELLSRAEEVLVESGVEALSLRSLARDLGVSHAAPARHFRDRQALLDALAVEGFERLGGDLTAAVAVEGDFQERVLAAAKAYVGFAIAHPALLDVMYSRKHGETDDVRAASDACAAILLGLFADGGQGVEDPERFAVLLLAALHGIADLAGAGAFPSGHDPQDVVVDLVGRLIRAG